VLYQKSKSSSLVDSPLAPDILRPVDRDKNDGYIARIKEHLKSARRTGISASVNTKTALSNAQVTYRPLILIFLFNKFFSYSNLQLTNCKENSKRDDDKADETQEAESQ